jgi:hypothetical protein
MELSDKSKKAEDLNWADYCDALLNEAWLERRRPLMPFIDRKDRTEKLLFNEGGTDL